MVKDKRPYDLYNLFSSLQKELTNSLEITRGTIDHPGAKGGVTEIKWVKMLSDYLPRRYEISKGFVIDSSNEISQEQDVIIYDRHYSPLVFKQEDVLYIPAESVYAVFEVKQLLDKHYFYYASEKIGSVRRLSRTSVPIPHAGGEFEPKPLHKIVGGILTLESDWSPLFGAPFHEAVNQNMNELSIDLGCVLKAGAFLISYKSGAFFELTKSSPNTSLVFFLLNLLKLLQIIGTVPAINYDAYSEWLDT